MGLNFKFALQRNSLKISWTPAQQTLLFFMTGKRPTDLEVVAYVNGVRFQDSDVHVDYLVVVAPSLTPESYNPNAYGDPGLTEPGND